MKIVLGSGLIGNLAKSILGSSWQWIPFKRSRYYSFDIPYADNFISYDKQIDEFISKISSTGATPIFYKRPISYQGQLMYQDLPIVIKPYISKIYGDQAPSLASKLIKSTFTTYQLTAQSLYHNLEKANKDSIREGVEKFGDLSRIDLDSRVIVTKEGEIQYEYLLSTIPLNVLCRLTGVEMGLPSKPICYYYLISSAVDLEGAEQTLVADLDIEFFKVQMLRKNHYIFWTFEALENPLQYFGSFLDYKIDIVEAKRIDDALPLDDPPDLSRFEEAGIYCVGSNAQWDDFMDVGSCIKRLFNLSTLLV